MALGSTNMILKTSEKWGNEDILFSGLRALYIKSLAMLVVSDLHLGKSGYFQQMGAAIPSDIHAADLANLQDLLNETQAEKLLVNGDLFHAGITTDVPLFKKWMQKALANSCLKQCILVRGNHDKYSDAFYQDLGFQVVEDYYYDQGYLFIHDPEHLSAFLCGESAADYSIALFGHVHAGVVLKGKGRQKIRKAAFVIEKTTGTKSAIYLPAFGTLTGIKAFAISPKNQCILASEGQLFEL